MVAIRQGSIGHLRYVMKDTLQMLPLYGHYFYQHGCIYVKRGNFKQKKMEQALEYLQDPNIQAISIIRKAFTMMAIVFMLHLYLWNSHGQSYFLKEHVLTLKSLIS